MLWPPLRMYACTVQQMCVIVCSVAHQYWLHRTAIVVVPLYSACAVRTVVCAAVVWAVSTASWTQLDAFFFMGLFPDELDLPENIYFP